MNEHFEDVKFILGKLTAAAEMAIANPIATNKEMAVTLRHLKKGLSLNDSRMISHVYSSFMLKLQPIKDAARTELIKTRRKLTETESLTVFGLLAAGISVSEIARKYNVGHSMIKRIKNRISRELSGKQ